MLNFNYLERKVQESPYTTIEISELLGISRTTLFKYRKGNNIPSQNLDGLIKLLNLDLEQLFN
ncbi:Uncharacterised protein [uncultured Clostridium sp.]|nr:Uncharacterised protein [uncultured Clostridium sp.]SCI89568.1 Uncharacterised protein [uncultured Clostridium sp.]